MTRFVVVTGSDTGVGKTWVTRALARALGQPGARVVAIKPFETGCEEGARGDGEALAEATGQAAPRSALVRLRAPLAPPVAAEREGVTLDLEAVLAELRRLSAGADWVLVEGAGGALSPLTWDADATTLAERLDARVVLVAADRLGTLSATHAAARCLSAIGRPPAGIVLSAPERADDSTGTNAAALRRRLSAEAWNDRVLELPRGRDPSDAAPLLGPLVSWLSCPGG